MPTLRNALMVSAPRQYRLGALLNLLNTWYPTNFSGIVTPMGNNILELQTPQNVEAVTNRDFEVNTTGWAPYNSGILTIQDGTRTGGSGAKVMRVATTTLSRGCVQNAILAANTWYRVSAWAKSDGTLKPKLWVGGSANPITGVVSSEWQRLFGYAFHTGNTNFYMVSDTGLSGYIEWDDVSVEKVGWSGLDEMFAELVANGSTLTDAAKKCAFWKYPNNLIALDGDYGKLYSKYVALLLQNDIEDYNAINPSSVLSYKVPSKADLSSIAQYGGNKLKAAGTDHWLTANGTNLLKLSIRGAGYIDASGDYQDLKATALLLSSDPDFALKIIDADNSAVEVGVTSEAGSIRLKKTITNSQSFPIPDNDQLDSEISMLTMYGQSLSVGVGATSVATDFRNALSFVGGPNEFQSNVDITNPTSVANFYGTGLVNLESITDQNFPPVASASVAWMQLFEQENGINLADYGYKFLLSSPGMSGIAIDALSKGTIYYDRLLFSVQKGKDLATVAGKSFSMPVLFWVQGEANLGHTIEFYKPKLKQLFIDLNTDIKAITGQVNDVQFITYQTSPATTQPTYENSGPSWSQVQLALEESNVHSACAMYQFKYMDIFHPSDRSIVGLQMGIAAKRLISDNKPLPVFYPKSHSIIGNTLKVVFDVPVGPMRFDISKDDWHNPNGKQPNFGFTLKNLADANIIASEPTIENGNTLVISCTESPVTAKLSYAIDGHYGGGNLCDSQNIAINNKGINYIVDNFAVAFRDYII